MPADTTETTHANTIVPTVRFRGPIWTLLILAPVIAEVLSGSTRVSILFVLIPEIMVWGGGALLCRELVRRWQAGSVSLLFLGLALSIAEEFIIQQTSLAPLPFPGANAAYGRIWGVNWVYLLFMLAYESVWVVLVPVQVTELIFPTHRHRPWLRKRGLIAACIAFLLGSRIAWYGWTQQARPRLHAAPYSPPILAIALAFAAIALLIIAAYLLRAGGHSGQVDTRRPASLWLIGIVTFILGTGWWYLMTLIFGPPPAHPAWIPLTAGIAWALVAFALIRYWSAAKGWSDIHRCALSFGATLSCMCPSYISTAGWLPIDLIGKIVLNLLALGCLILLARLAAHHRQSGSRCLSLNHTAENQQKNIAAAPEIQIEGTAGAGMRSRPRRAGSTSSTGHTYTASRLE
jgi:hypothetical protein